MASNFVVYVVHLSWLLVDSQLYYVVFHCFGVLLVQVAVLWTEGWVHLGISAMVLCGDGNVVCKIDSDDPLSLCMCCVG